MSLAKEAQMNFDGVNIPMTPLQPTPEPEPLADAAMLDDEMLEGTVLIQVDEDEPMERFDFKLPMVPGAEDQSELKGAIEVEEDEDLEVEHDPWAWNLHSFLAWLQEKMHSVPQHPGNATVGCERAIAYLEMLDKEISRAVRMDLKNEIAIEAVEEARDEIHEGLDRLYDRLDQIKSNKGRGKKRKKKAEANDELTKQAGKATRIDGISVTVPLFISGVVRTCLNSMVSAGKDIEDCFHKLAEKYNMTDREIFEALQLFSDMGYAIRRPRGYNLDEEIDYTSTDNFDWGANYPG